MTDEDFIEKNAAAWLARATIDDEQDLLPAFVAAGQAAADDLAGHELSAVLAAHGRLAEESRGWVGEHLRNAKEGFVADAKDELMQRVAAVALVRRIVADIDDCAILSALAVTSAGFVGLTPVVAELGFIATQRLTQMGREVRVRDVDDPPDLSDGLKLPPARKVNPDEGLNADPNTLASDIAAQSQAIRKLAGTLTAAFEAAASAQSALDEEVEMLWWVITDRGADGKLWANREPVERAVAAATELEEHTKVLPEPPAAAALLQRLLVEKKPVKVTLADFAEEAYRQEVDADVRYRHTLLPVLTAAAARREFGTEDDANTWRKVAHNKWAVETDLESPLDNAALQLYRELQMRHLVGE
jgi:hypothetical protein